jgi:hypothetical protein
VGEFFGVNQRAHVGRSWAAIHDNTRIPADFRLYLTATLRILASPRPHKGADGKELELASMGQDSETYGPWLAELGLSEAIERGILAGFEIDVLEIQGGLGERADHQGEQRGEQGDRAAESHPGAQQGGRQGGTVPAGQQSGGDGGQQRQEDRGEQREGEQGQGGRRRRHGFFRSVGRVPVSKERWLGGGAVAFGWMNMNGSERDRG